MLPTFHMATMPPRIESLKDSIPSILNQCSHLYIYLNNFNGYIPRILKHRKITPFLSENHLGDLGDVGKFYLCDSWDKGYHFTADDKIIYPSGYSYYMISKIEQYQHKCAVSLHGRNFHSRGCNSYYFDCKNEFNCYMGAQEQFAHEIGTGVMAFHSDTFMPSLNWFPYINMTDILISVALQKLSIPMLIADFKRGYIKRSTRHDDSYSIHHQCNRSDKLQTKIVNSIKWKINIVSSP